MLPGKYIVVQGIITKSGELQLHCNRMTFKCRLCGKENVSDMIEGRFMTPASCDEEECNAKRPTEFEPIENSSKTRLVPSKRFCIQEGFSSTVCKPVKSQYFSFIFFIVWEVFIRII